MLDAESILTTAVEVAIAIAGFSGVVVALGPRQSREWTEPSRVLLSSLLLMTIAAVGFAFLPLIMGAAGITPRILWPVASAIHAFYLASVTAYRTRQTLRLSRRQGRPLWLIFPVVVSALGLQLANAVFIQLAWPYLAAIVLMVLCSFGVFAALLRELWAPA